ncbi:MAG TPA: hypothetical protein VL426_02155 [Candidatus Binatia bacterium]|jgi:hypothetical protein|nr:hypothetical protein [Candidatus Binatia bacterium]
MTAKNHLKTAFVLALGGTLFAGYLSAIKLFTGTCAFNETCPYFLGYPSCWYGFGMFLSMAVVSAAGLLGKLPAAKAARANAWIALAGTLFAGYFVSTEVAAWLGRPAASRYGLVLPTCVYGLVFYVIILALSVRAARAKA